MDNEIKKDLASNWFKLLQNAICNDEFDVLSKRVENLENKIKKLETKKKSN